MKKYTLCTLLLLNFICLCSALEISLEPVRRNVVSGRFIQLKLSSDKQVTAIDFPAVKNARWENSYNQSGMQNINGKVTYTRLLMLSPEAEGSVTIPPFKVTAGKETAMTKEVKVNVLPRDKADPQAVKISDVVKGRLSYGLPSKEIWAGEELTLYCDLLVDEKYSSQIRITYFPELLNTGNAVFKTFNYRNGKVRFQMARSPEEVVENKQVFLRYRFTARCRVLAPGNFSPKAAMQVGVIQQNAAGEDDFFGGFGSSFFSSARTVPYKVEFAPAPPLTVKALPPVPQGALYTSLVGSWQISGALSSATLHQGEVAELTLNFKGSGGAEQFRAPELKLPQFRIYPPEVTRNEKGITVKYALIPLVPGEQSLRLDLCVFDPVKGAYTVKNMEFKAAVMKSAALPQPSAAVKGTAAKAPAPGAPQEQAADTPRLYYQKSLPGKPVRLTLIENNLWWILFFALAVPVIAVLAELYFRRREKEANSPGLKREKALKKALAETAAMLREKGDTPEFRSRLIPLLGEAMGLSAGATAGEIASKIPDKTLCRYFSNIENASFLPGAGEKEFLDAAGRSALLKFLKKFTLFLLCFAALSLPGSELNKLFNAGEYAKAAEFYRSRSVKGNACLPGMLYNYGNCRYYLNDLPEARHALNLAALLDPGDGEIRSNLHLVNARLFESADTAGSFTAALRELRDKFRPDNYIVLAAFCWALMWVLWAFRRKTGTAAALSCGTAAGVLMVLFLFCAFMQMKTVYAPDRIIVTASKVQLRTLPGINSGSVDCTLSGGCEGKLLSQENPNFARVRINGREGWLPVKSFKRSFPGTLF